jgi:hypothetical protein
MFELMESLYTCMVLWCSLWLPNGLSVNLVVLCVCVCVLLVCCYVAEKTKDRILILVGIGTAKAILFL